MASTVRPEPTAAPRRRLEILRMNRPPLPMSGVPTMDGASGLFCGSMVGKPQHSDANASAVVGWAKTTGRAYARAVGVPTILKRHVLATVGGHGAKSAFAHPTRREALLPGRPRLVIAGGRRSAAARERRARGAVGGGRAGHIRNVRLF